MRPISPLQLLPPGGLASRVRVLGSGCPERLLPPATATTAAEADLAILAPTAAECQQPGWLKANLHALAAQLAPGGVAYVLAPLPWRPVLCRWLAGLGLPFSQPFLHLPNWGASQYLIPLAAAPARYALESLVPVRPWKRLLVLKLLGLPAARSLLGAALPPVGFAAQHADDPSLLQWLLAGEAGPGTASTPVISAHLRGSYGSLVVHTFAGCGRLSAVAKCTWQADTVSGGSLEGENLARLGPAARQAGARVPEPLSRTEQGGLPIFWQSAIAGRSAAALLAECPDQLLPVMASLTHWLEAWHRSTLTVRAEGVTAFLERAILAPARSLAAVLPADYLEWLARRCAAMRGPLPLVAVHNDLTTWNVLIDAERGPGIVDWAEACAEGLPFVDFCYAALDAIMVARSAADRCGALAAFFTPHGPQSHRLRPLFASLRDGLTVPDELAELCFHACFLHHAANEYHAHEPADPRPFLHVVQWLAAHRPALAAWIGGSK